MEMKSTADFFSGELDQMKQQYFANVLLAHPLSLMFSHFFKILQSLLSHALSVPLLSHLVR